MVNATCPKCGDCFPLPEPAPGGDWCNCLPWDGSEGSLPLGGQILVPGVVIEDLIGNIIRAPVSKAVIDVDINEDVFNAITKNNPRRILIAESTTGKLLTRKEWKDKYKTDGLVLWAIRDLYLKERGPGVRTNNSTDVHYFPIGNGRR